MENRITTKINNVRSAFSGFRNAIASDWKICILQCARYFDPKNSRLFELFCTNRENKNTHRSLGELRLRFYQRVSIARGGMSVCLSVCPSVRPSVTLRYCIKTKKASVMISSPSESQNILFSRNIWFITKFVTPSEGDFWDWGGYELTILAIFRPINRRISETVQDRTKVTINH